MVTYPSDWTPMQLKDLGCIQMCRRIFQSQTKEYGDIPFYKISTFGNKADAYISRDLYEKYKALYPYPEKDDVLISAAGTVGKAVIFDGKDSYFQDSNIVWLKVNKDLVDRKFLWWFYRSYPWEALEGTTIQRLYNNIILKTSINLPSIPEQKEIAQTLSTFDTYIDDLSELIEKKKNIRDGALEDLISGKTRLGGFEGDWQDTTIGDCVYILQGGTPSTTNANYWNGNIVWVTPSEITKLKGMFISDSERKITEAGLKNSSAQILPAGTILLCSRATIGELAIASKPMTTNQGFKNLVCKVGIDNVFMAYLLSTLKDIMISKAKGTTFLELSKKALETIKVKIPKYEEQQAIASVLTVMDKEIEHLEAERDKMIQIREGAMDDLLTGRVRLTV